MRRKITGQEDGRPAGALVLGGGHVGLGLARSLGRRDITVWCLIEDYGLAGFSRYCRVRLRWPGRGPERQRDFLLELCAREELEGWALYPTSDENARVLALHHAELADSYRLTVPAWETFRVAYDKRLMYRLAEDVGVDVPTTYYPGGREDVVSLPCSFPVVLKPAVKENTNAFTSGKAWRCDTRADLLAGYEAACSLVPRETVLVQSLVQTDDVDQLSFAGLCMDGEMLAWLAARRLRQYPDAFGVATYVESIDAPALEPLANRLLSATAYSGLFEMDFIHERQSDTYYLLDFNPRAWSWLALGRRAGVDFPYLVWEWIHGRAKHIGSGSPGARWRHAIPDLEGAYAHLRRGRLNIASCIDSLLHRAEGASFAWDDPLPGMLESILLLRQRFTREHGKLEP